MRPIRIPRLPLAAVSRRPPAFAAPAFPPARARRRPAPPRSWRPKAPPAYYLALGDSLAQGVQPDASGVSVRPGRLPRPGLRGPAPGPPRAEAGQAGLPGRDHRHHDQRRDLPLRQRIAAQGGGRLPAAHRGRVLLVTLDIGANDPEACSGQPSFSQLAACAVKGIPSAVTHLGTIVSRLKAAAGPGVRIVGMNYYLPALAEWRSGLTGRRRVDRGEAGRRVQRHAGPGLRQGRHSGSRTCSAPSRPPTSPASGNERPAQRHPAVPVDLGVRRPAPRAQPAREPGRLPGHRPYVPASRRPELTGG